MELGNYKIKVTTEAESKEAQELFFALGYMVVNNIDCEKGYIVASKNAESPINFDYWHDVKNIITIQQLRDLVVLHRNDVNDANYTCSGKPVLKLDTQDYKVWDSKNNTWTEHVGSQTDLRKGIKPIQPEQCLISGADALRALADGKEVELQVNGDINWHDSTQWTVGELLTFKSVFRLKPRTITLNIEIPAPFEPKDKDNGYVIDLVVSSNPWNESDPETYRVGAWRTEAEIKQVVAALRGALKNG